MMKTKIYKIVITLLLPVIFYIITSGFIKTKEVETVKYNMLPPANNPKDFTNFILNRGYEDTPLVWDMENHLNQYRDLNFNGVHIYDWGSSRLGKFDTALSPTQISNVKRLTYRADTTGLKSIFERTKISRLCYGQRLEYEVVQNVGDKTTNFGFCYKSRDDNVGSYKTDSGRTVLHSITSPANNPNIAGWLCDSIYENMQHTDLYYFLQYTDLLNWHLKPMMRIDTSDFNLDSTTPVIAIISYNFKGNPIDTVTIRVNNFRDASLHYNGQYIDKYTFNGSADSLAVNGSRVDSLGLNYGYRGNEPGPNQYNVEECKVDFKVYWYGLVDVWFDKLTVDDENANILFDPNPGSNYDSLIYDEVSNFGDTLDVFFADELVYSQLPCLKYVQDKIRTLNNSLGKHAKLSYALSNNLNIYTMRNNDNAFNFHLDITQPDIIQIDGHPFTTSATTSEGAIPIYAFSPPLLVFQKVCIF